MQYGLVDIITRLIDNRQTDGLQEKLDVFFAVGRLTQEEYEGLVEMLAGVEGE